MQIIIDFMNLIKLWGTKSFEEKLVEKNEDPKEKIIEIKKEPKGEALGKQTNKKKKTTMKILKDYIIIYYFSAI